MDSLMESSYYRYKAKYAIENTKVKQVLDMLGDKILGLSKGGVMDMSFDRDVEEFNVMFGLDKLDRDARYNILDIVLRTLRRKGFVVEESCYHITRISW